MKYFDHDSTAGNDDKIVSLRLMHGGAAVDAYWCILEELYRCETEFKTEKNQAGFLSLSHRLCIDVEELSTFVSAMVDVGLLEASDDGNAVFSERAKANIETYHKRQETARENGKKGGRKPKANRRKTNPDTKGKPQASRGPARPETKEKEKLLDTHKGYPNNYASGGAAAAGAAPPAAKAHGKPPCPLCKAPLFRNSQTGKYDCPVCLDSFEAGAVVWP